MTTFFVWGGLEPNTIESLTMKQTEGSVRQPEVQFSLWVHRAPPSVCNPPSQPLNLGPRSHAAPLSWENLSASISALPQPHGLVGGASHPRNLLFIIRIHYSCCYHDAVGHWICPQEGLCKTGDSARFGQWADAMLWHNTSTHARGRVNQCGTTMPGSPRVQTSSVQGAGWLRSRSFSLRECDRAESTEQSWLALRRPAQ